MHKYSFLFGEYQFSAYICSVERTDVLFKQELIDKILEKTEGKEEPQPKKAPKIKDEAPKTSPKVEYEIPEMPVRNREKRHRLVLKNKPVASVSISNGTQSYQNEQLTQQQTQQVPQASQQPAQQPSNHQLPPMLQPLPDDFVADNPFLPIKERMI